MRHKPRQNKLTLNRETLRNLSSDEAAAVVGGAKTDIRWTVTLSDNKTKQANCTQKTVA